MKGFKSTLALLIVVLLIFSMAPFQAFAEEAEETTDEDPLAGVVDVVTGEMEEQGQLDEETDEETDESSEQSDETNEETEDEPTIDVDSGEEVDPEEQVEQDLSDVEGTKEVVEELEQESEDEEDEQNQYNSMRLMGTPRSERLIPLVFIQPDTAAQVKVRQSIKVTDLFEKFINNKNYVLAFDLNTALKDFKAEMQKQLPLVFAQLRPKDTTDFVRPAEKEDNIKKLIQTMEDSEAKNIANYNTEITALFSDKETLKNYLSTPQYKLSDEHTETHDYYCELPWIINYEYSIAEGEDTTLKGILSNTEAGNYKINREKFNPDFSIDLNLTVQDDVSEIEKVYFFDKQLQSKEEDSTLDLEARVRVDSIFKNYDYERDKSGQADFKYQKLSATPTKDVKFGKDDGEKQLAEYIAIADLDQKYTNSDYILYSLDVNSLDNKKPLLSDGSENEFTEFLAARCSVQFSEDHEDKDYEAWNLVEQFLKPRGFYVGDTISGVLPAGKITSDIDEFPKYKSEDNPINENTPIIKPSIDGVESKDYLTYDNFKKDPDPIYKELDLDFKDDPNKRFTINLEFPGATLTYNDGEKDVTKVGSAELTFFAGEKPIEMKLYQPVKKNYVFKGWYEKDSETSSDAKTDFKVEEAKNVTYVAEFEQKHNITLVFEGPSDSIVKFNKGINGQDLQDDDTLVNGNKKYTAVLLMTEDQIKNDDNNWQLPEITTTEGHTLKHWQLANTDTKFIAGNDAGFKDWLKQNANKDGVYTFTGIFSFKEEHLPQFTLNFNADPYKITKDIKGEDLKTKSATYSVKVNSDAMDTEITAAPETDLSDDDIVESYWKMEGDTTDTKIKDATTLKATINQYPGKAEYKFTFETVSKIRILVTVDIPKAYKNSEIIGVKEGDKVTIISKKGELSFGITGNEATATWAEMFRKISLIHKNAETSENVLVGFDPDFDKYKSGSKKDEAAKDITFQACFVPKEPKYDGTNRDKLLRNIHAGMEYKKSDEYKKLTPQAKEIFDQGLVSMAQDYNNLSALTDEQYNQAIKDIFDLSNQYPNTNLGEILKIMADQNKLVDPATGVSLEWTQLQPNDKLVVKNLGTETLNNTNKVQAAVLYDIYIERNNKKLILENLSQQIRLGIPVPAQCREVSLGYPRFKDGYTVYYVEVNGENKPTQLRAVSPVNIEGDNKAYFITNHLSYWAIAKPLATGAAGTEGKVDSATAPNQTTKIPATGEAGTPLIIAISVLCLGIALTVFRKRLK